MIGIYKITSPTNKVYIGQSWNIEKRKSKYKNLDCERQPKIYNSLLKYGWEEHKFQVIHELPIDVSQDVLDTYEIFYINQYKDCGIELMNVKEGGGYGKHNQETKDKIRQNNLGKKQSEETKKKRSNSLKGKKCGEMTNEMKEKISNTLKGRTSQFKGVSQSKVKCPYCDKEGGKNLMTRYHFENCKNNN
jgi:group I intron endonuclease